MERVIQPSGFDGFNKIAYYDGEIVLAFNNARYSGIKFPENWKDNITIDYDWVSCEHADGFIVDDNNIRNARKLTLEKNDVFRIMEDDSTWGRKPSLYIPAKITPLGTVEKDRDKFGYSIYNRYKIDSPIKCFCHLSKDIGKEAMDKIYASGKVIRGEYFYDEEGRSGRLVYRSAEKALDGTEAYIKVTDFEFTASYFYCEKFVETIHNEYYDQCKELAAKFGEITHNSFSKYDIDSLLKVFDITEKIQEA